MRNKAFDKLNDQRLRILRDKRIAGINIAREGKHSTKDERAASRKEISDYLTRVPHAPTFHDDE